MNWSFGKKSEPSPQSADKLAKAADVTADVARAAAFGTDKLASAAATTGVALAVVSGPALPVVAGIAVLVAVAARMYNQNTTLNRVFAKLSGLIRDVLKVLTQIEAARERRAFAEDFGSKIDAVRNAAAAIQTTIGKLVGPETLQQLSVDPNVAKADRTTLASRFARFKRRINPEPAAQELKESVNELALQFSILQGAFAIELEKLIPADAKAIAETPPKDAAVVVSEDPSALDAAEKGAEQQPPTGGNRKKTRRRRRSKTRRLSKK